MATTTMNVVDDGGAADSTAAVVGFSPRRLSPSSKRFSNVFTDSTTSTTLSNSTDYANDDGGNVIFGTGDYDTFAKNENSPLFRSSKSLISSAEKERKRSVYMQIFCTVLVFRFVRNYLCFVSDVCTKTAVY